MVSKFRWGGVMRNVFLVLLALVCCLPLTAPAQAPQSQHVYIVVEENHSFENVVGQMPYLNGLAAQNVLLVNHYSNAHYSIPNYMFLTTGQSLTLNDGSTATFNVDNIVRHLQTGGKTWKAYQEGIPSAGYLGGDWPSGCGTAGNPCTYVRHHDPFAYLGDVANSSTEALNIVPFTQLSTDISGNSLPNYAFITPSEQHNGHDSTLATADSWLQANIAPLLATAPFQPGGDGILIITFDEGATTDCRPLASCPPLPEVGGGGRIYTVIIGPQLKQAYQSPTTVNHNSILRMMMQALGLGSTGYPGGAATAPDLTDIFAGAPAPSPTPTPSPSPTPVPGVSVSVSSPTSGSTIPAGQLVQISATATSNRAITAWHAYANSVSVATGGAGNTFSAQVTLAPGAYTLVVRAWDSSGANGSQSIKFSVASNPPPPGSPTVTINSPASGSTVNSPVVVSATFSNGGTAQYMKVWVDGVSKFAASNVTSITTPGIAMTTGSHRITVQAYNGTLYSSSENITVP
ncbi:MAG TPA: alkaline phosphatase family protein [Terriglobales bacterium]|nr:alkaline phosphatase family protein [Terriglobales bacterium]